MVALFGWTHRYAIQVFGFADDIGLYLDLPRQYQRGLLAGDVWQRVIGPLWGPGSVMWRPLPYASMALDAMLYGSNAGLWRITNVLLHLLTAITVAMICRRLVDRARDLAAIAGFATVLLLPWAPETTFWMVGRFDGFASLFVALSLWAALVARDERQRHGRYLALSLIAAVAAYASKEAALALPAWVGLCCGVLALRDRAATGVVAALWAEGRANWRLLVGHAALAAAYLAWRAYLFGSASTRVYGPSPLNGITDSLARLGRHLEVVVVAAGYEPRAAIAAAALALVALVVAVLAGGRTRWLALLGSALALSIFAAAATHYATALPVGDGFRFYHLAALGIAVVIAAGVASLPQRPAAIALVLLWGVALAVWQNRMANEWRYTARALSNAVTAIAKQAPALPAEDYGLVLLADPIGHVPASRNAQGSLLSFATLANPEVREMDRLILFVPLQIAEWHGIMQTDVVRALSKRTDAPPRPTKYYCMGSDDRELRLLGYWPATTVAEWTATWRERVAQTCPSLKM